jgi:hypothetical protein
MTDHNARVMLTNRAVTSRDVTAYSFSHILPDLVSPVSPGLHALLWSNPHQ